MNRCDTYLFTAVSIKVSRWPLVFIFCYLRRCFTANLPPDKRRACFDARMRRVFQLMRSHLSVLWPDLLRRFCELPLLEEGKKWDVSNSGAAEIWRAAVFISEIWQNCSVRCRVLQGFPNTPSLALTLSARLGSQTDLEITLNLRSLPLKSSQLSPPSFTTCYFVFMCLNLSVKLFNSPVDSSLKMSFGFILHYIFLSHLPFSSHKRPDVQQDHDGHLWPRERDARVCHEPVVRREPPGRLPAKPAARRVSQDVPAALADRQSNQQCRVDQNLYPSDSTGAGLTREVV